MNASLQQSHTKKRMTIMISAIIIIFGGIMLFNLIKGIAMQHFMASFQSPTVTISSITALKKSWRPHLSAVGNFVAINGVDVNSQVSGNVVAIHFESGQILEQGTPLIDIDDSVEQANLKFNQADLALRKLNYQRQTDLIKRGATAASSVDEAHAKLLEAEANLEKTQAYIRQKHIVTPFTGRLGIRQINLGQYILPGQTAIATLQSLDPIYLEFFLPEQYLKRLHLNQAVTFSVEQNPGVLFTGKITAINSKVDSNTHTIEVQATLPNCPVDGLNDTHSPLIRVEKQPLSGKTIIQCDTALNTKNKMTQFNFVPGMFAALDIDQPSIPDVVVLPTTAISFTLYGDSVFVIEKNAEGKKDQNGHDILTVKRVFVTTGDQQGNYTVIKKGITAGQLVVASGELKLQNGTQVTINNDIQLPDTKNPSDLGQ
jgi:membrane fusion protein (multidrug efflux system)